MSFPYLTLTWGCFHAKYINSEKTTTEREQNPVWEGAAFSSHHRADTSEAETFPPRPVQLCN